MQLASFTHAGRRKENQDCVRIETLPGGRVLAALADGMGGHQGGAYASRRALEVLTASVAAGDDAPVAVAAANAELHRDAQHPDRAGMGTTVVGVLSAPDGYLVFNVGDSRCYRIDDVGIAQLSVDHSFVADAIREGTMARDEAEATPWKNALTRSLGGEPTVEVDRFGPFAGDTPQVVVLCSDGVYKSLPDDVIEQVVRGTPDAPTAARALADLAYFHGSDDNLSVVVLEFGTLRRASVPFAVADTIDEQAATAREPALRAVAAKTASGSGVSAQALPTGIPVASSPYASEPNDARAGGQRVSSPPRGSRTHSHVGLAVTAVGATMLAAIIYLGTRAGAGERSDGGAVAAASGVVEAASGEGGALRMVAPRPEEGPGETTPSVSTDRGLQRPSVVEPSAKATSRADSIAAKSDAPGLAPASPARSDSQAPQRSTERATTATLTPPAVETAPAPASKPPVKPEPGEPKDDFDKRKYMREWDEAKGHKMTPTVRSATETQIKRRCKVDNEEQKAKGRKYDCPR